MRGNVYISIPASDKDNALPSVITKYDWTEVAYNDEGEVESTSTIHPTWAQYGEKYKGQFGAPVVVGDHIVYEIEASWQDSEVSALVALGKGKAAPNYTIMTASEARAFIIENQEPQL
jgi:hypothetical protein